MDSALLQGLQRLDTDIRHLLSSGVIHLDANELRQYFLRTKEEQNHFLQIGGNPKAVEAILNSLTGLRLILEKSITTLVQKSDPSLLDILENIKQDASILADRGWTSGGETFVFSNFKAESAKSQGPKCDPSQVGRFARMAISGDSRLPKAIIEGHRADSFYLVTKPTGENPVFTYTRTYL